MQEKGVGRKREGRHPGVRNSTRKGIIAVQKGTFTGSIQYSIAGAQNIQRKVMGDMGERMETLKVRLRTLSHHTHHGVNSITSQMGLWDTEQSHLKVTMISRQCVNE